MKNYFKVLLITVLLNLYFSNGSKCQIVFEQEYDSSAQQLSFVNFQINGGKYVRVMYPENLGPGSISLYPRKIDIYNLNHSLWKTIPLNNIAFYPVNISAYYAINYLSDSLFDTDNLIEFSFTVISSDTNVTGGNPGVIKTFVYNENQNLLFSDSSAGMFATGLLSIKLTSYPNPIFNTSTGTKMILNSPGSSNSKSRVYSLPGQLSRNTYSIPTGVDNVGRTAMKMNLYPKPSSGNVTVEYDLPADVLQADLVFYDVNGKKIKSFKIDHTFHNLYLSNNDLASGTYYCQIETTKGALGLKKMIRVD